MAFWTLYKRELRSIFVSPVAYVVLAGCALMLGAAFVMSVNFLITNNVKQVSVLAQSFQHVFFWFVLMIQAPLIAMRSFSEEYKMGTIEMLLTAPVREWEVVLAKYAAILSFFAVLWVPQGLNLFYLYTFSNQKFDVTWGMALLPVLMLFLFGAFYTAISLFASSLTKNQVVAAILGFGFIFLSLCVSLLTFANIGGIWGDVVSYISCLSHMDVACRGIFDTRPVVFYLSGTFFFLFLTQRVLEARRLRS